MNLCYGCMQNKPEGIVKCSKCGHINGIEQGEHYYLPEGTKLNDRYILGKVLGHGGFGITYIGLDTKFDILVAIKEYLPSDISTRALGETTVSTFSGEKYDAYVYGLGRFIDEAKTLAKYNSHQCIVSINDYFEENNTAYIVMEYLDGISLSEYIKRNGGKISLDETLSIMRPVMDALKEVHSHGMIHRDVSPDNIFITKDKQIKLLDFGAARHAMNEKSKSLSVVLKPGYAPPEQYYTKGKQGPWTDVYAAAATMYKCITGVTPPEAMERMDEDNDTSLGDLASVDDMTVRSALLKALSVRASKRQQSVGELAEGIYTNKIQKKSLSAAPIEGKRAEEIKVSEYKPEKKPEEQSVRKPNKKEDIKKKQRNIIVAAGAVLVVVAIILIVSIVNGSKHDEVVYEPSQAPAEPKTTEVKVETVPEEVMEDGYPIALITDAGEIDDRNFNQDAWEGIVDYAFDNKLSYKYFKPYEVSDAAYIEAIERAVMDGAKVIVTPGFLFGSAIYYAQDVYPDIRFVMLDASPFAPDFSDFRVNENVYCIYYDETQLGFLAGYAAVKEGFTKLGYMGGMAVPAVVRFGYGFVQGAEFAALEMGIKDIEVKYHYTGDFEANSKNEATALTWYNSGTEVIFAVGGKVGNSVMTSAEKAGAKVIGVDVDQSVLSETVITSAIKKLGHSAYMGLDAFYNDSFKGGEIQTLDVTVGCVGLEMENSRFNNFSDADYNDIYDAMIADSNGVRSSILNDSDVEMVTDIMTKVVSVFFVE